jgi:hypothetical protein
VSRDGVFDPEKIHASGRAVVLIQNAIHAGEMDGKDSCLALLRDILVTREKAALLDRVVMVILPIYNADGHERFGAYNRINQNGRRWGGARRREPPAEPHYMKADAPETARYSAVPMWLPDSSWTTTSPTAPTASTTPPAPSTAGGRERRWPGGSATTPSPTSSSR